MRDPLVHVVGAGLAGLAAAVVLAKNNARVVLHESGAQAGGRCRSYFEPALGMMIDNGNHIVLSGNRQAMAYVGMIGALGELSGPEQARFDFVDLATSQRWCVRPNGSRLPWWIFSQSRRVPGSRAADYLALGRILLAGRDATIADAMRCSGLLYDRLWHPLLLAALNTDPAEASAALAAKVIRETLALGGKACRPLVAGNGLSRAFVDPALAFLARHGAAVHLGHRLRAIGFSSESASMLHFADGDIALHEGDSLVLAVPAATAAMLVPGLVVPTLHRAIVNGHFQLPPPRDCPAMLGVVNGTVEWIFAYSNRLSITISGADRLLDVPREKLAQVMWRDIQAATAMEAPLPPWQVIKEKRATFAALPGENSKRPPARTPWRNLVLAGDFTDTGLPATIEGAVRSGFCAAAVLQPACASI